MKYVLSDRVVIGIASSALFDLADCDAVFREQGEDAYRRYQEAHVDDVLDKGVAFPFVRRLLSLNDLAEPLDPLVEVIILSRNDPDTGLRRMDAAAVPPGDQELAGQLLAEEARVLLENRNPLPGRSIPVLPSWLPGPPSLWQGNGLRGAWSVSAIGVRRRSH